MGLTFVEPDAAVDVKEPGVMAMVVAPLVAQLSWVLVPELMVDGFAVKEVIVGTDPLPGGTFVEPI